MASMWPFFTKKTSPAQKARSIPASSGQPIFFTNTLSGKKESFIPIKPGFVTMYSCGPTVYSRAHVGNMRAYVFADLIARTLRASGLHVRQVINITDVGHLIGDGDEGEDKIEKIAKEEGQKAETIASMYAKQFIEDIGQLNLSTKEILFPRATEYIQEQIAMVKELEKKGFTYRIHDGVYFDTSKFHGYGKLGGIHEAELKTHDAASSKERAIVDAGRRIAENKEKRHPADFALWKFSPLTGQRQQEWSSPWGLGFPGWHIECSAMIRALLGKKIDIHTGGIDLIPIHHNNEIAQSESLFGEPFVHYWMHGAFLNIEGEKISKSLKNDFYVSDLASRGIHPLALRYFFLQAHYRSPLSFSWDALMGSNEALGRLWRLCLTIELDSKGESVPSDMQRKILTLLHDDLGTPQALAYLWECLRDDDIPRRQQRGIIEAADPILGLSLLDPPESARRRTVNELPDDIEQLTRDREKARLAHDFEKADTLREKLRNRGYLVEDGPSGPLLTILPK